VDSLSLMNCERSVSERSVGFGFRPNGPSGVSPVRKGRVGWRFSSSPNGATGRNTIMPQSFGSIHLHDIFSTKHRQPWLTDDITERLHGFVAVCLVFENAR
jgi:hypothetical protein